MPSLKSHNEAMRRRTVFDGRGGPNFASSASKTRFTCSVAPPRCTSPFTQKVLLVFDFKGIEFEWVPAPLLARGELVKRTGDNKVPVLEVGGRWVADSTAIVNWAEEHRPEPSLYPSDPWRRQLCRIIEDWADETLTFHAHAAYWCPPGNAARLLRGAATDRPTLETRLGVRLLARMGPRLFRKLATARRSESGSRALLREQLDMLERLLESAPYLVGEEPTIADFSAAAQIVNLSDLERAAYLDDKPRLAGWIDRLAARLPRRFRALGEPGADSRRLPADPSRGAP